MNDKIPNPFYKEWKDFDMKSFKNKISVKIEKMTKQEDPDDILDIIEMVNDDLSYLYLLLVFKDLEELELIPMDELPDEYLEVFDIQREDLEDSDASIMIPKEYMERILKPMMEEEEEEDKPVRQKKPPIKNDWLI